METIILVLLSAIAGLFGYVYKQNKKLKKLDNEVQTKEHEIKAEKHKRKLAITRAAVEGAKRGAQAKVDEFYSKYGHLVKSDDQSSNK